MSFRIGDKVKIIIDCTVYGVYEINGGLGMEGEITECLDFHCYQVKSNYFIRRNDWCFSRYQLKLITESLIPVSISVCPRCGGELYEKQTSSYGIVNKCKNCGWC
jgi:hypothetical protein